jgi:hypothetical protein
MIERGPTTANEMVLTFVRAEIESRHLAKSYAKALAFIGATKLQLIDQADLSNPLQNRQRSYLLGRVRGYGRNTALFDGLPIDISWRRISITPAELGRCSYMSFVTWLRLSNATRRISDGAANIRKTEADDETSASVLRAAALLERGKTFPPLIAIQSLSGRTILMQGNIRATAKVLTNRPTEVEMLLGTSPLVNQWRFY